MKQTLWQEKLATLWKTIKAGVRLSPAEWRLVYLVLAIKVILLFFGMVTRHVYQNEGIEYPLGILQVWNQWDGPNYLYIAEHGYVLTGDNRFSIVFFPGYPLLVALGIKLGMPAILSGYVVTSISSIFVAILLFRLAKLDQDEASSHRAVWFLFIFPTAYFLHVILTESTFLMFALGAFLAARKRRWSLCGVLGFFTAITRMNGLLLIPALIAEAWYEWRETRRLNPDWIFILCPVMGIILYLTLNYDVTGNAFTFLIYQREHWHHHLIFPWMGMYNALQFATYADFSSGQMTGSQEFIFAWLGLAFSIAVALRMRLSYAIWCLGNWLLICSMTFLTSTPRYILLFFPMFILWGEFTRRRPWFEAFTIACLLFFGMFAAMYGQRRWAF